MNRITAFFTALVLIITHWAGLSPATVSDGYELTKTDRLNPVVSMFSGQGLCCDGEHFYASGSLTGVDFTGLAKFDLNMRPQKLKAMALPKEIKERYGSDHIGGIDCAGGLIYAPVEGDGYVNNLILLYDCETLAYTGTYYDLSGERFGDGIPWCAVDEEAGLLYTSRFDNVTEIYQYDLKTMEYVGSVKLDRELFRLQGGSVYDGTLYLCYDVKHSADEILWAVDLKTGRVSEAMTRYIRNYDNEAEDVCVYPLPDGSLFHFCDYDKLISTYVYHVRAKPTNG